MHYTTERDFSHTISSQLLAFLTRERGFKNRSKLCKSGYRCHIRFLIGQENGVRVLGCVHLRCGTRVQQVEFVWTLDLLKVKLIYLGLRKTITKE